MIALSLLLALSPSSPLANTHLEDLSQRLNAALGQVVEQHELPGLAVAVVQSGEVVYMRGFGLVERGTARAVTPKSIFHMASISKPFVATAVMLLVEEGKLDLEDKLVKHLPYFKLQGEAYREITIRQVLQHTSGMPDVSDYEWDKPQTDEGAAERLVRSLGEESLRFPPGSGEAYSNLAFDVLGDLIAKASGMSFEDYLEHRLLDPLGMQDSSFMHSRTPAANRTTGHSAFYAKRIDNPPSPHYPYNRRHAPSSTLNSSLEDMCKWMLFNLSRGASSDPRRLSDKAFDLLFRTGEGPGTGLAWSVGTYSGMRTISHSGSDVGFKSNLFLVPELELGIVLMGNCDSTPLGSLTGICVELVRGNQVALPAPSIEVPFARILEEEGFEAAIEAYEELRTHPTIRYIYHPSALDSVASNLLWQERFELAANVLMFNLEEYPDDPVRLRHLAQAMQGMGEDVEARELLRQVLDMRPGDSRAKQMLEALKED